MITITVTEATQGAKLHWGVKTNGSYWQQPNPAYWPAGTVLFNGTGPAVESPMSGPGSNQTLSFQAGPFNNPAQAVQGLDFVLHYNDNTWNNNNGQDFHIAITQSQTGIQSNCSELPELMLYPNPVDEIAYIRNFSNQQALPASLYDITGKLLLSFIVSDKKYSLDMHSYSPGIYFIRFCSGNEVLHTIKLFKL